MMQTFQYGNMEPWVIQMLPFMGLLLPLILLDVGLKGWGMWRAAKMNKMGWFVALLLLNTAGIVPAIFLLVTNDEYKRMTGVVEPPVPQSTVKSTKKKTGKKAN